MTAWGEWCCTAPSRNEIDNLEEVSMAEEEAGRTFFGMTCHKEGDWVVFRVQHMTSDCMPVREGEGIELGRVLVAVATFPEMLQGFAGLMAEFSSVLGRGFLESQGMTVTESSIHNMTLGKGAKPN